MTTIRGTPNLTIAATQNTAPVYEFRCLYSHDLRKKKKLWHDGSLRYHTFNKRVMVYDESKNYIGDSHWRDAEELQEGTEFKLDKGVLVDVGDRIGETQTDLAPLLEKRRPENASSPQRPPLQPIPLAAMSRSAPRNSQARPKSLSDVLGVSQGPIGRARIATQSHYGQLRRPTVQRSHCEEPLAKKPRIGSEKENGEPPRDRIYRHERPPKANVIALMGRPGAGVSPSLPKKSKAAAARQIIDISAEAKTTPLPSSPPRAAPAMKASSPKASTFRGDHQQPPTTSKPPPKGHTETNLYVRGKFTPPKLTSSKPLSALPGTSYCNPSDGRLSSSGSSKTKLRLAVHKPRKKLLYEELLPSSNRSRPRMRARTPLPASCRTPTEGQQPSRNIDGVPPKVRTFSGLESGGKSSNAPVEKSSCSKQPRDKEQEIDCDLAELFAQSSSPLFMPESPTGATTRASEPQCPKDFSSKLLGTASALTSSPRSPTAPHRSSGLSALGARTPTVNCALQLALHSEPTILNQELTMPPPKSAVLLSESQQPSPLPRPLRRVVSENDSPKYTRVRGFVTSLAQGSHTNRGAGGSKLPCQRPFKNPAKLTKALSATAGKSRARQPPAAQPADVESTEDHGPWSKAEAYLLFDWFPPGYEKLVPEHGVATPASMIVVKRGLLSDQVDAL